MERVWDEKIKNDPYAFVPHELRGNISIEDALIENMRFGSFSAGSLGKILRTSNFEDRKRRCLGDKKLVAVGAGKGYDSRWVEEAVLYAGLGVIWVDVSERACDHARVSVDQQFSDLQRSTNITALERLRPMVIKAEIRTALLDPLSFGIPEPSGVEVWYLSRILGCLSKRSAKIVLQLIARSMAEQVDPLKENCALIVSALREDNPTKIGHSSKLYTLDMIKSNMRLGAKRPVGTDVVDTHMYFGQKYSSVLVRAK